MFTLESSIIIAGVWHWKIKSKIFNHVLLFQKYFKLFISVYFREHLEMMVDQLKIKLQDTQNNLQISVSELQTLQSEHDTLLERHNKMLQETVSKEAELREK